MNICKTAVRGCIVQFVVDVEEVNQCFCSSTFQQLSDAAGTSTHLKIHFCPFDSVYTATVFLQ